MPTGPNPVSGGCRSRQRLVAMVEWGPVWEFVTGLWFTVDVVVAVFEPCAGWSEWSSGVRISRSSFWWCLGPTSELLSVVREGDSPC